MKKTLLNPLSAILVLLACGCARLHAWPAVVFNPTNGVILIPTNFVVANLAGVTVTNTFSGTATNLSGNALVQATNISLSLIPTTATNLSGAALAQVTNIASAFTGSATNFNNATGTNVTLTGSFSTGPISLAACLSTNQLDPATLAMVTTNTLVVTSNFPIAAANATYIWNPTLAYSNSISFSFGMGCYQNSNGWFLAFSAGYWTMGSSGDMNVASYLNNTSAGPDGVYGNGNPGSTNGILAFGDLRLKVLPDPTVTKFSTNVLTSVAAGTNASVTVTTNASGIALTINGLTTSQLQLMVGGLTNLAFLNANQTWSGTNTFGNVTNTGVTTLGTILRFSNGCSISSSGGGSTGYYGNNGNDFEAGIFTAPLFRQNTNSALGAGMSGYSHSYVVGGTNYWINSVGSGFVTNHIP